MRTYSRDELLELRTNVVPSAALRRRLYRLLVVWPHQRVHRRGSRAGQWRQRPITVRMTQHRSPGPCYANIAMGQTLIPCPTSSLIYPPVERFVNPLTCRLRAGLLNIRSVNNKTDNVPDLLNDYDLNLLVLTETWHENDDSIAIRRLRAMGLNVVEAARNILPGVKLDNVRFTNHGGIAIVSKPGVTVAKINTNLKPSSFEHLCCRIGIRGASCLIGAIYRPGSQAVTDRFLTEFTSLLESLSTFNCPFMIVGDINIHLELQTDSYTRKFLELIDAFKLRQYVTEPTHEQGGLLDAVISTEATALEDVSVVETGLSDHRMVHWCVPVNRPRAEYRTVIKRCWRNFNQDDFIARLEASPLCSPTLPGASATDMADCYHSTLTNILDAMAPVTAVHVRPRFHRPFFDDDCKRARRHARRCERVYRRLKGTSNETGALTSWRAALKASRRLVRTKGRHYWRTVLDTTNSDAKSMWNELDRLLGKSDITSSPAPHFTAEDYHQYMVDKISRIRDITSNAGSVDYNAYAGASFTRFTAPTTSEVVAMVQALPDKQCKADPIPLWLLKATIGTLAPYLTTILATSLASGDFPMSWKSSVVYPHLKMNGLDPEVVGNYRPIANLQSLSKLLERWANKQLVAYLLNNGLLPRFQSAYRRGHSTETATLKIFNDIVDAIANGHVALLCGLDLSAAFDTVDHAILIRRLQLSFGIHGLALDWIRDYLDSRTESVCWKGQMTTPRPVGCGVPQGSVLGPLLFVLYVADLESITTEYGLASHAYADDTQLYATCLPSDIESTRSRLEDCLHRISSWTSANRLVLNPGKTKFILLCPPRRRHLLCHTPLRVDDVDVAPTSELRLLGVLWDETLSLDGHVSNVVKACFHHLRRIRDIRRYLTIGATIQLVRATILSRLDYCNSVFLGLPARLLNRLQSVLNVAARLIFGVRWGEHVTPLLRDKLHWLKIPERIIYKRCCLSFRAIHDPTCPIYLKDLVQRLDRTGLNTRLRSGNLVHLYVPPPSKTVIFGERSMTRGNPQLWNALPHAVTTENSYELFTRKLKTHLFKNQGTVVMVMPSTLGSIIVVYLAIGFALKLVDLFHVIMVQSNVNLFLIDWERPTTQHAPSADGTKKQKQERDTPVSIWRTYFVANEWNELQTLRKINPMFQIVATVFFLDVVGFGNLATEDPHSDFSLSDVNSYHSSPSSVFRFGIFGMVYLLIALAQWLFFALIYDRFFEDKMTEYIDFCSMNNISVFILENDYFGYYIHGQSVHGRADVGLREMHENFARESRDLCSKRGLLPESDQQTFQMALPKKLKLRYDRILLPVLAAQFQGGSAVAGTNLHAGGGIQGDSSIPLDPSVAMTIDAYGTLNHLLQNFLDHTLKGVDYSVVNKSFVEQILDMEFKDPSEFGYFYRDNGHSFDRLFFYGNEIMLLVFEMLFFGLVDHGTKDFLFTGAMLYILMEIIIKKFRDSIGKSNLAKKTLVDKRFLI